LARLPEFLELIKSLGNLYRLSLPAEKQQIAEMATSNRRVCGKNIYVEPSNWLLRVEQTVSALCGPQHRATERTKFEVGSKIVETFPYLELEKIQNVANKNDRLAAG
jgi:hypothetical protein